MGHTLTVFAFGWDPEIRGIVFVMIGVLTLCGSVYLLLGTNLGARLGLLVTLGALFGWITILGIVWLSYASTSTTLGLQGRSPTWVPKEIVVGSLDQSSISAVAAADPTTQGFVKLTPDNINFGQSTAAADEILVAAKKYTSSSDYVVTAVYNKDGHSWPSWGPFDFFAWFHRPHWAIVEVQPVVPQETEPGRAPPKPIPDTSQPPVYVVMLRDLGTQRVPATFITIGAACLFGLTMLMLYRREKLVIAHMKAPVEPTAETDSETAGV